MKLTLTKRPKAVIFDVDKTLTISTSWYELTDSLGADTAEHARLYTAYKAGTITYKQAKDGLFKIWNERRKKIHRQELEDLFFSIELRGDAISTIGELQRLGYVVCLISSSIDLFIQIVAKRLSIKHWYANSVFEFDENGYWIDFEYSKDEAQLKVRQLEKFLKEQKLKKSECVAVGDGETDVEMFRTIPGVAVHCDFDHLNQLAWQKLKYLPRLVQLLESLKK